MKIVHILLIILCLISLTSCKLLGKAWIWSEGEEHTVYNLIEHVQEDPMDYLCLIMPLRLLD